MLILACLWIIWCILHSFLISRQAHDYAHQILGRRFGAYRICYVVFSVTSLIPVLWYQFSLPEQILLQTSVSIRLFQVALLIYAAVMFYLGARVYDMHFFLGIIQWRKSGKNQTATSQPFDTDGILAHIRHPWYSGGIAFLWGFGAITDVYLLSRSILSVYLVLGTFLEEKRMGAELGDQYIAYCRRVPRLFPWKGKRNFSSENSTTNV